MAFLAMSFLGDSGAWTTCRSTWKLRRQRFITSFQGRRCLTSRLVEISVYVILTFSNGLRIWLTKVFNQVLYQVIENGVSNSLLKKAGCLFLFFTSKPASIVHCLFAVAVGAKDIAFINFGLNGSNRIPSGHELWDGFVFAGSVMEFQDNRVRLSTRNTWVSWEILIYILTGNLSYCLFSLFDVLQMPSLCISLIQVFTKRLLTFPTSGVPHP